MVGGAFDSALERADALLFGRRTWQVMAAAWPERAGDPFADRMNSVAKYVVSGTLGEADLIWNNSARIPGGTAIEEIRRLHESGTRLSVIGSSQLAQALLQEDLIDELCLIVMPVILGGGKTIFPRDGGMRTFELTATTPNKCGTVVSTYRRAR